MIPLRKIAIKLVLSLFAILTTCSIVFANEFALNGFLIQQFRGAIKNTLGDPVKIGETEHTEYEAYRVGD